MDILELGRELHSGVQTSSMKGYELLPIVSCFVWLLTDYSVFPYCIERTEKSLLLSTVGTLWAKMLRSLSWPEHSSWSQPLMVQMDADPVWAVLCVAWNCGGFCLLTMD